MNVLEVSAVPAPKDRVIMVLDMTDDVPLWEIAHWADYAYMDAEGYHGGWCVADHDTLRAALPFDEVAEVAVSVMDTPTHWAEVPALPAESA